MTAVDELTPSDVPVQTDTQTFSAERFSIGRFNRREFQSHRVRVYRVPAELRITLEVGSEEAGAWARIPELQVSGEGAEVNEAMQSVLAAARDWLVYLRDEEPDLTPELEGQRRYVALLEAPYGWFKRIELVGS